MPQSRQPTAATMSLHVTWPTGGPVHLLWYPRLLAPPEARNKSNLPMGLHWPELDEDISIASMLRGAKAPGAKPL
jgi:hypothetical protein